MIEIESVLQQYQPLSEACSRVYFILESLGQVHYLYEFSLVFFMEIFQSILSKDALLSQISKGDLERRRKTIYDLIFLRVYQKV